MAPAKHRDPRVKSVSIKELLDKCNYLLDDKFLPWDGLPEVEPLYRFTSQHLYLLYFKCSVSRGYCFKLEQVIMANRDGSTEYDLFDAKYRELEEYKKTNSRIYKKLKKLLSLKESLPPFETRQNSHKSKPFKKYIEVTTCKTNIENLKNKYVVFDVETNGLRTANDDLLSLSILDPSTGIRYHRYFPLDLQPVIATTEINGITEKKLEGATHITQQELDELIEFFHLKERILLSYSGGRGLFDKQMFVNYCKRHQASGFDELKFENIKSLLPISSFESNGNLTKDKLCRLLHISGVRKIHTGVNDCILEWKLYEQLKTRKLFFIDEKLYEYFPEYVIPISYLNKCPILAEIASVTVPAIEATACEIFRYSIPEKVVRKIKKYPTNITGIALENAINYLLAARRQNNAEYLKLNKQHLRYIGSITSKPYEIPVKLEDDGMLQATHKEDEEYIEEINNSTKLFMDNITEFIDYIKYRIFSGEQVLSQELCISKDGKVLSLCDLSSSTAVVEIKTGGIFNKAGCINSNVARQLFYQSHGRNTYIAYVYFDVGNDYLIRRWEPKAIHLYLYEIKLNVQ